ncbi:hypothetical protein SO802_021209 [Lithocarpus litseifolius]|uniref:Uncharacterized protein n=1 Tax=Lithocarpus litseifolius TaxID=425828 RepID=A0AAW2CFQ8_9ROSI
MLSLQGDPKVAALRKKGCPFYDKLRQLLAPTITTSSLQISSNTPASDSEEEHALEEKLAIEVARTHLSNDNCYTPNMEGISEDDPPVIEQTQRVDKHPIQEASSKGKKVAKKRDSASEMTTALQEYTALAMERFSQGKGRVTSSSNRKIKWWCSWACQSRGGKGGWGVILIREIIDNFFCYVGYCDLNVNQLVYDFDDAYFNSNDDDIDIKGCDFDDEYMNLDYDIHYGSEIDYDLLDTSSDYDIEEEEFLFVFLVVGEMATYFQ